ncbi:MAG: T9SS type A sorting domain-containing protein [Bacteroidetes bacterium]|nr:MAG: T9SS type A sorting domain-containing protein [Bacteroidota bacterium]
MKKILLALALLGSSALSLRAQTYSGGSGTKADPYQIATKADLKYLSENADETKKHFLQTADIHFNSTDFAVGGDFYNNGEGFIPLGMGNFGFEGSYHGGGHIIDSLYINRPTNSAAFLLRTYSNDTFGYLGLTNVNFTGSNFAGAFAGQVYWGTVMDVYATGVINGEDRVGGIAGANSGAIIRCYSNATVNGNRSLGGIVGGNEGIVHNCYATGAVTGTVENIGGLCGYAGWSSNIRNCFSAGMVSGANRTGGLIGYSFGGSVSESFWDSQTSGWVTGNPGSPRTTAELQSQATFAAWDFANTWKMGNCITNNGYPILKYQTLNIPNATVNFTLEAEVKNEFCNDGATGEIDLTVNGTSDYTYSWSSGAYSEDVIGLAVGTYNLVVTDKANCGTIDTSFDISLEPYFNGSAQATASAVCVSGPSTVSLSHSAYGAKYFLRDSNNTIVDGPVIGTGGAINFTTGNITTNTNFSILGASINSGNSLDTVTLNAMEFTGNTDAKLVSLGTDLWADSFVGRSAFTIEAWINRSDLGHLHTIFSNYNGSYPLLLRIDNDKIAMHTNSAVSVTGTSILPVGEWIHIAGTYDGTSVRLYVNGIQEGLASYNQTLIAANGELKIGGGINNGTEYFRGSIADVRLWNRAKTATEIQLQMNDKLVGTEAGLVANYQFNEGNGAIVANSTGAIYHGNVVNNANWVTGPSLTQVLCTEQFATTVMAVVSNDFPDSTTSVDMQTITSNEDGATYQWIDCNDNNKAIDGATSQSYTATVNGSYAVIVSNGTCTSTSACVNITNVGMEEIAQGEVLVYPNPSQGKVTVQLKHTDAEIQSIKVLSVLGKELSVWQGAEQSVNLDLSTLAKGVYFIAISVADQTTLKRIVIE